MHNPQPTPTTICGRYIDTTTAVYYWYTRTDDGIREVIYINMYMYMYDILM